MKVEEGIKEMNDQVRKWKIGVISYLIFVFLIYFFWFGIVQKSSLSPENSAWGQAGDFIGGMLNPVVALAAFFWLTKGVQYQKEELANTYTALAAASIAQKKQADNSDVALRLEVLSSLINSKAAEINFRIAEMQFLTSQLPGQGFAISMLGKTLTKGDVATTVSNIATSVQSLDADRLKFQAEIESILKRTEVDSVKKSS